MLFAETTTVETFGIAGLAAVLGGAVTWATNFWVNRVRERRDWRKADQKEIVDYQSATIERLSQEMKEVRSQLERVTSRLTSAIAHLMYLEGLLEARDIKFKSFPREMLGSGELHVPDEGGP